MKIRFVAIFPLIAALAFFHRNRIILGGKHKNVKRKKNLDR
jgi:hypothetical protein